MANLSSTGADRRRPATSDHGTGTPGYTGDRRLPLAVWLGLRVRRDVRGRTRWLLYPVVGVLALLAVGGRAERVLEATAGEPVAAAGELVVVGGHRQFIACGGTGSPTVVLEGGLSQSSAYFARNAQRDRRTRSRPGGRAGRAPGRFASDRRDTCDRRLGAAHDVLDAVPTGLLRGRPGHGAWR
ncbi:MAG: hypothetical protein WCK58_03495 [Chloroflexota bacterium]